MDKTVWVVGQGVYSQMFFPRALNIFYATIPLCFKAANVLIRVLEVRSFTSLCNHLVVFVPHTGDNVIDVFRAEDLPHSKTGRDIFVSGVHDAVEIVAEESESYSLAAFLFGQVYLTVFSATGSKDF